MRYVLAAILVCAIGAPAALALPSVSPEALGLSKADPVLQVAKRSSAPKQQAKKSKSSSSASSGIHPLVGSGEY